MAELVYAPVSGTGGRKAVEVQVLFWAQSETLSNPLFLLLAEERVFCFMGDGHKFFNDPAMIMEIFRGRQIFLVLSLQWEFFVTFHL